MSAIVKQREKYHVRRQMAIDYLGGVCKNCGLTDRLQFDHIKRDRQTRRQCISQMLLFSWDKVVAELQKCQLLCISCHALKSCAERGSYRHGSTYTYVKLKCKCDVCRAAFSAYNRKIRARRLSHV